MAVEGRAETERVAAQDQALQIKYYATKMLHTETDSKCRLCQQFDKTADHIISACLILAKEQYIKDMIECVQLHFHICKERGIKLDKNHWYQHVSESVKKAR